jgi:hypothetical protein
MLTGAVDDHADSSTSTSTGGGGGVQRCGRVDVGGGVNVDAEQNVLEVREGIDVVQVAGRDQRVEAGEILGDRSTINDGGMRDPEPVG